MCCKCIIPKILACILFCCCCKSYEKYEEFDESFDPSKIIEDLRLSSSGDVERDTNDVERNNNIALT